MIDYHETDEYKARLEHEALDIADDILSGKHGEHKAAEIAYDIIGSMSDKEFVEYFKDGFDDLAYMLRKKVAKFDDVIRMAEQRIIKEDNELMADELAWRAKEDRLDAAQEALEAEEAAYMSKYGGID